MVSMKSSVQTNARGKGRSIVVASPVESFPLEVVSLLDVFARIELRRQARRRSGQKEAS